MPLERASFDTIFEQSATVVIHDCMFARDSFIVITDEFFDHGGLDALQQYYRQGGTVMVQCVEGIYAIGDLLSKTFGCRWRLVAIESSKVILTERGRQLLGEDMEEPILTLGGKVHFMQGDEGVLSKKVYTKEEFEYNCSPDSDDEDAYTYPQYLAQEQGQHAICIHEGPGSEGKLIWNGDRGQNDSMKLAFSKLICPTAPTGSPKRKCYLCDDATHIMGPQCPMLKQLIALAKNQPVSATERANIVRALEVINGGDAA